jgi:hypothetical protein
MASPDRKTPPGDSDPIRELLDEKNLADEISRAIEGNDCPADAELEAYLQKGLKEPERIEVKSHLTFCGKCRKKVEGITSGQRLGLAGVGDSEAEAPLPKRGPPLPSAFRSRARLIVALLALAVVSVFGGLAYFHRFRGDADFPYSGRVVYAEGKPVILSGRPFSFEIRTPEPIYLIEIAIDGEGRISTKVSGGTASGQFTDGQQLQLRSEVAGEFDLYLLPCPARDGFPDRLLDDLQKFLKTVTALSRENLRSDIEVAIRSAGTTAGRDPGLYKAKFLHQVFRIEP